MALPQMVTKTYSRRRLRQADPVSKAERTFDEVFRGTSRPPARAAATAEKWGSASFKRIANVTRTSPKRRLSSTHDTDDPFLFDSDDDNIAKKSRKENVRQTTISPRKQTVVDGEVSAGEKSRSRTVNYKTEKSSVDGVADKRKLTSGHDERHAKQFIEKMKAKCQPDVKSGDSERNGISVYHMSASAVSGRGDSLDTNDRKCRTNGLETSDKKSCSPTSGRNTRGSVRPSPCKTTEQLKVFVDNFSQLFSSQRSSSGKHRQLDADISVRTQSSSAEPDPSVKKSKNSENCDIDVGNSHLRRVSRVGLVKIETGLSSPLHHSKQLHRHSDDDEDDDDVVLFLSSIALPSTRSSHRLDGNSGTGSSGTCSQDTSSSGNSSPTKTTSRISTRDTGRLKHTVGSGNSKNELVGSRSGQSRSHRWRTTGSGVSEPTTAITPAAATTTTITATSTSTTTRRLLTSSQKVLSMSLVYIAQNIDKF